MNREPDPPSRYAPLTEMKAVLIIVTLLSPLLGKDTPASLLTSLQKSPTTRSASTQRPSPPQGEEVKQGDLGGIQVRNHNLGGILDHSGSMQPHICRHHSLITINVEISEAEAEKLKKP